MTFGVAILGAGASRRMGRPKLLLPWGSTTVLGHLARTWWNLGADQVAVVIDPANLAVVAEVLRLSLPAIRNEHSGQGMFSSVRCAGAWAGWSSGLTHIVLALGDQPRIPISTLESLLREALKTPKAICQPFHNGKPRHPILFPRKVFCEVAESQGPTLREFLASSSAEKSFVQCVDGLLELDLDTPEDYQRLLALAPPS